MAEQERTEQATPKKRQEARKRGEVARSKDVVATAALVGAVAILAFSAEHKFDVALEAMQSDLGRPLVIRADELNFAAELSRTIASALSQMASLLLVVVLATLAANWLQVGFLFLPNKMKFDGKRLSPVKNLSRLASWGVLGETGYGLLKFVICGAVLALTLKADAETIASASNGTIEQIVLFTGSEFAKVAYRLCGTLLALAALDYGVRRWKYEQDIKMTQQELRDELKEESGAPQTKGRRQQARRSLFNSVSAVGATTPPRAPEPARSYKQERAKDDSRSNFKKRGQ